MPKKNNNKHSEKTDIKRIKYGIIAQNSTLIKINELFKYYFEKSKCIIIKNEEKEYEFTLEANKDLHYIFIVLNEEAMKNIIHLYASLNFFLIFIDIQSTVALKNLENYVDKLIACSQDITKKSYIFGAFKENNLIVNSDEKISTILNCKGIDYEYSIYIIKYDFIKIYLYLYILIINVKNQQKKIILLICIRNNFC